MIDSLNHLWLRKAAIFLGFWFIALSLLPAALAQPVLDKELNKQQVISEMWSRQGQVADSYTQLDFRVKNMDPNDPRKNQIMAILTEAQNAKNAFVDLSPEANLENDQPNATFVENEKKAIEAMNNVNRFLFAPVQPGAGKVGETGTVPGSGTATKTLTEDFIPTIIRLLFRFTSLMILVSFVVSGVMMVVSYDNEERVTKAKHILYYSLVGFAAVTLAYAIVKAITQVNYFGII